MATIEVEALRFPVFHCGRVDPLRPRPAGRAARPRLAVISTYND